MDKAACNHRRREKDFAACSAYSLPTLRKRLMNMPIIGVGTDIVEVERIRRIVEKYSGFAERVFTRSELEYCLPKSSRYLHLAARFAAKEAVAKSLGSSFSWHEVEIINNINGKPEVVLHRRAKEAASGAIVHISLSHTRNYACAVAVVEVKECGYPLTDHQNN